ncbi:MAG: hybrid sensor histidine kinase/response regulator [Verrucomicrobia bacterium]|nr:hybrid sensor histidine kinase/response regulator [Verrucomicrobiota bacterium]
MAQAHSNKPRVLAVDDTPDALKHLRLALRNAGMDAFTAQTGQAAIDFLNRELVDVIISDVTMPGMDGYELCRQVKFQDRTKHIPVLFLTANVQQEDRARGIEVGGLDYVTKPLDHGEFNVRLRVALTIAQLQNTLAIAQAAPAQLEAEAAALRQRIADSQPGILASHWHSHFGRLAGELLQEVQPPLTGAILGVQRISVIERVPEEVRDRLSLVDADFRRVNEKLRRLMLVGAPSRTPRVIYLAEFVQDLIHLMASQLRRYNVLITTEFDPTCQWRGMPSELGKAFLYLLNNALEAPSDLEKAHVLIRVEQSEERQFIRIADNGPGVPEDLKPRIYESFFTTKGPPHTGAGLYLASAIVRAANGTIDLESPSGDWGALFSINLPSNMSTKLAAPLIPEGEESSVAAV